MSNNYLNPLSAAERAEVIMRRMVIMGWATIHDREQFLRNIKNALEQAMDNPAFPHGQPTAPTNEELRSYEETCENCGKTYGMHYDGNKCRSDGGGKGFRSSVLSPHVETRLINHGTRNGHVLMSFVDYCIAHPSERFWQALLNWSGLNYITHTAFSAAMVNEHANYQDKRCEDTYYWEGRNG